MLRLVLIGLVAGFFSALSAGETMFPTRAPFFDVL